MYLRTTRRNNRDGSVVTYYQLAHNVRDADTGHAVAQVVHNFGRADELDRDDLVRLCRSIARVCGVEVHDPGGDATAGRDPLPPDVVLVGTRPLGAVLVADALWERLGVGPTLRRVVATEGRRVPYERALFAMVANRLCAPESKLGVWERWLETVHLPSCDGLKLEWMYEAMDVLHRHAEEVERAVFFETASLLNLEVDLVFFDTTTVSFAIDAEDEEDDGLRRFGYAKEGTWAPQVVVALAVTRDGLPVRSWVLPGNTADVTVVERIRADLRGWKLGRALFVADSGFNSEENREELARGCGRYVLAMRAGSVREIKEEVLGRAGRYATLGDNLRAKEVVVGEGERRRRYIVCFNPAEAERQAAHRARVLADLRAELARHPAPDADAKWAVELRASGRYGRYLAVEPGGRLRIDAAVVREVERLDGKWVLLTNDDTLTTEDAAKAYRGLMVIERCFRTLKRTRIRMQPMYHWVPRRIEAHVRICVLALLLERVAELACGRPWPRIRADLDRLQASCFTTDAHRFFRVNALPPEAGNLLDSLDVKPPRQVLSVDPLPPPADNP